MATWGEISYLSESNIALQKTIKTRNVIHYSYSNNHSFDMKIAFSIVGKGVKKVCPTMRLSKKEGEQKNVRATPGAASVIDLFYGAIRSIKYLNQNLI